jgi:hypothetical protein
MNGSVKCVENQRKNSECMHVKCKFVVIVMWDNYLGIIFHFYHLATILWGFFSVFLNNNEKFFYNFYCYIVDENVQMRNLILFFPL